MVTFKDVIKNEAVKTYINAADKALDVLGYTEHSYSHVTVVAKKVEYILSSLGYSEKEIELAKIAAYLHDIGNLINRIDHAQSGAVIAFRLLDNMGMDPESIATVVTAIGNHDEGTGVPVDAVSAALILADKSDVRRNRVRHTEKGTFDIHDRVNYSVENANLLVDTENKTITLNIQIDLELGSVMEYFEIFMARMLLCKKAAAKLRLAFRLIINGQKLC